MPALYQFLPSSSYPIWTTAPWIPFYTGKSSEMLCKYVQVTELGGGTDVTGNSEAKSCIFFSIAAKLPNTEKASMGNKQFRRHFLIVPSAWHAPAITTQSSWWPHQFLEELCFFWELSPSSRPGPPLPLLCYLLSSPVVSCSVSIPCSLPGGFLCDMDLLPCRMLWIRSCTTQTSPLSSTLAPSVISLNFT